MTQQEVAAELGRLIGVLMHSHGSLDRALEEIEHTLTDWRSQTARPHLEETGVMAAFAGELIPTGIAIGDLKEARKLECARNEVTEQINAVSEGGALYMTVGGLDSVPAPEDFRKPLIAQLSARRDGYDDKLRALGVRI